MTLPKGYSPSNLVVEALRNLRKQDLQGLQDLPEQVETKLNV